MTTARPSARASRFDPRRNIVPDRLDLRDRPYMPELHTPPAIEMTRLARLPVLDQQDTSACTGFALASVVNFLLRKHRDPHSPPMSPFMLYSMARRYDEFPGSAEEDRKSTRLNSSHTVISYAVFCLKKKKCAMSGDKAMLERLLTDQLRDSATD